MPEHDLVVIGGGPGGYVAAIRAAQLGLDVACVEMETALGGTCLRVGCIPSKALLESSERFVAASKELARHGVKTADVKLDLPTMLKRKETVVSDLTKGVASLLKKNKVRRYLGRASLTGPGSIVVDNGEQSERLSARRIILATGSRSAELKGVKLDGDLVGTSTEALSYSNVPKTLVVIGAGYIGLEMAAVWSRLGARVIVLEYLDRILPGMDSELAAAALKLFKKQGLEFRLSSRVVSAKARGEKCVVEVEGADGIDCDRVLLAVGRVANTEGLGLDKAGVACDERGRVVVDERFATNVEGIYAIGDVIRGPMLAHKAEEEGMACVEGIVTGHGRVDYNAIPAIVYTHPEIASVGRSEDALKEAGIEFRRGVFHFRGNGRARALGETDGWVKVLADASTDRLLGVHIIGPHAGDLIAEAATAISFAASSEDLALCSHAHPTLCEALKEAALAVDGRAIHA